MRTDTRKTNQHPSVGKHPDRPAHATPAVRAKARQTEEPSDDISGGFSRILRTLPLTLAVSALSGAVFVTAVTIAAFFSPDPTALTPILSVVALALTALVGGLVAGKQNPDNPLAGSLLSGCLMAGVLLLLSLLFSGATDGAEGSAWLPWLMRLGVILIHALGGFLTRPRPKTVAHTTGKHPARR